MKRLPSTAGPLRLPTLPPGRQFLPVAVERPRFAAALAGVPTEEISSGVAGLWDDLVGTVKQAIPQHTVVGKALKGDYQGAAADATKFAAQATTALITAQQTRNAPKVPPMPNLVMEPATGPTMASMGMSGPLLLVGAVVAGYFVLKMARG